MLGPALDLSLSLPQAGRWVCLSRVGPHREVLLSTCRDRPALSGSLQVSQFSHLRDLQGRPTWLKSFGSGALEANTEDRWEGGVRGRVKGSGCPVTGPACVGLRKCVVAL